MQKIPGQFPSPTSDDSPLPVTAVPGAHIGSLLTFEGAHTHMTNTKRERERRRGRERKREKKRREMH